MTPEEQAIRDKREALAERAEREKQAKRRLARERRDVVFDPRLGRPVLSVRRETGERERALGLLAIVVMPFLGAAVGMWIGDAVGPQPDPNAFADLSGLDWPIDGALIGFLAGLVLGLLVAWAIWPRRPPPRR